MVDALSPKHSLFLHRQLDRLANANALRAIREGLLWIIPALLVSACFLVLAVLCKALGVPDPVVEILFALHDNISHILPSLVAASIGYMLSIRYHLPRLPAAFLCFVYVVIAASLFGEHPRAAATFVLFIAITSPLINVPIMGRLYRQSWTRIARIDLVGNQVREALNMVLPGILTSLLLVGCLALLLASPVVGLLELSLQLPLADNPYRSGILISGMNSLLWFFGVHGYHAQQPIFQMLDQAVVLNAFDVANGLPPGHPLNGAFMAAFVFIGGSGATFSLVLAILLFCRHRSLRLLAMASLPIGLLNVNEILLFGLPIILNPRLIFPFILVPVVNLVLALAATQFGILAPTVVGLPLTSPILLNAYLATGGDPGGVFFQVFLMAVGVVIYRPFIQIIDAEGTRNSSIHVASLDTTFTQLHEEASLYANDPIVLANGFRSMQREQNERIRQISRYEFYLEFQPQVSLATGLCTGCEALLRARDPEGRTQLPWEFLRWLEQAGLMKELDAWVAAAAVRQGMLWQAAGLFLPMTVNVTGASLESPGDCDKLVATLAAGPGNISIELTEQSLAGDVDRVKDSIAKFHAIGARVYIDDFGTGYSSLSYLHQFEIDAIKIDRSFVLAQSTPKGAKVMEGLIAFAEALELQVVVEGVETEAQRSLLLAERDLIVQGWYYSKSLSGERIVEFVRERERLAQAAAENFPPPR